MGGRRDGATSRGEYSERRAMGARKKCLGFLTLIERSKVEDAAGAPVGQGEPRIGPGRDAAQFHLLGPVSLRHGLVGATEKLLQGAQQRQTPRNDGSGETQQCHSGISARPILSPLVSGNSAPP